MAKSKERICRAMYNVLTRVVNVYKLKQPHKRGRHIGFHMEKLNLMIEADKEFIRYCASTMKKLDYDAIPYIKEDLKDLQQAKRDRLDRRFS